MTSCSNMKRKDFVGMKKKLLICTSITFVYAVYFVTKRNYNYTLTVMCWEARRRAVSAPHRLAPGVTLYVTCLGYLV